LALCLARKEISRISFGKLAQNQSDTVRSTEPFERIQALGVDLQDKSLPNTPKIWPHIVDLDDG